MDDPVQALGKQFPEHLTHALLAPGSRSREDVYAWRRLRRCVPPQNDAHLRYALWSTFLAFSEFRSLVDYRLAKLGIDERPLPHMARTNDLTIACPDIGGGLMLLHGFGSSLNAAKIGESVSINQLVTLGHDGKTGLPTIGNRVVLMTGCVVVGAVTIGDGAVITANAVVNRDVPPGGRAYAPRTVILGPAEAISS